jgi:hypothetical protein
MHLYFFEFKLKTLNYGKEMSSWFGWYIERFLLVHLPTSSEPLSSCLHFHANLIVITHQVRNPEFDLSIGCHIFPRQVPCRKDKKRLK